MCNCAVVQATDGRQAKNQDMTRLLCCLLFFGAYFKFTLSSAQETKNSIADAISHTLDCHCHKNYLHRSIKSHWIRISTLLRQLVLDKRTD